MLGMVLGRAEGDARKDEVTLHRSADCQESNTEANYIPLEDIKPITSNTKNYDLIWYTFHEIIRRGRKKHKGQ